MLHRVFVRSAGVGVAEVGETFDFARHAGESLELGGREQPVGGCDFDRKLVGGVASFMVPPPVVLISISTLSRIK